MRVAELLDLSFSVRISAKFFKIQTFFDDFFSTLSLYLLEEDTLKLRPYSSSAQKRSSCTPAVVFWNYNFANFLQI